MIGQEKLSPELLLALLRTAISAAPAFPYQQELSEVELRWLGRADALIAASGSTPALISFRAARSNINNFGHSRESLLIPLYDAFSSMELLVPAAMQGAFIAGGDTWNGYAAIVKIFQTECDDLLVIDPYLSSVIYTDLAPHAVAKNGMRCLGSKRGEYHAGLVAAANKWAGDAISKTHPVEVRYAPAGSLHDRLIIVDEKEVWLVSQSLKDIAAKSPASVARAEGDIGYMKIQHYRELWNQSTPLA